MEGIDRRQFRAYITKNGGKSYNFNLRGLKRHKNRHHVICTTENTFVLHAGSQNHIATPLVNREFKHQNSDLQRKPVPPC